MQIVTKYLMNPTDFINIVCVCKKYQYMLERIRINPIQITPQNMNLFPNIQTQNMFSPFDIKLTNTNIERLQYSYLVSYDKFLEEKKRFNICPFVKYTKEDRKKYGNTIPQNVCCIDNNCFKNCEEEVITIPNNIRVILNKAFTLARIREIEIPNSVTFLGDSVFDGCTNLTRVELPSSLQHIPEQTFKKCVSLKEVKIPSSITAFGSDCFGPDCGMESIVVAPNICVSFYAFEFSNLNHIEFVGQSIIADHVCDHCLLLKSVKMDTIVKVIGSYAFRQCEKLEDINVPSSLQIINTSAFEKCTSLSKFVIPNKLLCINPRAFYNCSNLKELNFPDNTKFCGIKIFTNCTQLSSLTLPNFNGKLTFAISKEEEEIMNKFGYTALDVVTDVDDESPPVYNNDEEKLADEKLHEVKTNSKCNEVVLYNLEQCKVFDLRDAEKISGQRF
ncbi:hypothetical protein EIN_292420 [Entamoeba invadens IP1]|uniref:Leucine rich repeat containing protein BspA family protein n=1 Tax=Entamoeba invadens IP1 TaxID=370355 RepID=A0A0A1UAH3_ENTIV|nr:hypothetical protein EIN_292420 [Entamoeba invadens IP1]ELP92053.1 hypothetical protein EIN_292420 [Entamoeba invadens IP1]|eukprot:XP_004258824.1 hypothetical protein EIN_292420 [Entamoeba invadens IP1]